MRAEQCLYIGDDVDKDVKGAIGVGLLPVLIQDEAEPAVIQKEGFLVTGSFKALERFIKKWNGIKFIKKSFCVFW